MVEVGTAVASPQAVARYDIFVTGAPDPGLRILLPSKRKSRRIQVRSNAATV